MAKAKATIQQELTVKRRPPQRTRATRRLRLEGGVPGVVYGKQMEPVSVVVNARELTKLLHTKTGEHSLVTLRLDDAKSWEKPVLVQSVQHDPVDGHVLHIDFHAVTLTERIKVKVPLLLKGEPVGVKQEGGILEHFLREVEVECLPADIPTGVEFDVSALAIGQTVHVRDLTPPANAQITSEPEGAVASVLKPKEEKPEEEAAAAVTEPEVIREKKEEPEGESAGESKAAGTSEGRPPRQQPEAGRGAGEPKKDTKS